MADRSDYYEPYMDPWTTDQEWETLQSCLDYLNDGTPTEKQQVRRCVDLILEKMQTGRGWGELQRRYGISPELLAKAKHWSQWQALMILALRRRLPRCFGPTPSA